MQKKYTTYFQLSMAMFFAGSTVIAGKFMMHIPIFISQSISLIFALIFIFPLAWKLEGKKDKLKILKKDWLMLFLQGATGIFIFRICVLLGLRLTSAIESGIIMSTAPALLALFSFLFLKERISKRTKLGIAISLIGIMILNTNGLDQSIEGTWQSLIGNLLILVAVIGEVLFTIFRKKQSYHSHSLTTTAFVILFAFLLFIPIGGYQSTQYDWTTFHWLDLLPMFYYGAFCSALGYTCWFSGISKVNVSIAAGFSGVMPITSVLLSVIILKEQITWQHIIGMLLALAGIYTISKVTETSSPELQKAPA